MLVQIVGAAHGHAAFSGPDLELERAGLGQQSFDNGVEGHDGVLEASAAIVVTPFLLSGQMSIEQEAAGLVAHEACLLVDGRQEAIHGGAAGLTVYRGCRICVRSDVNGEEVEQVPNTIAGIHFVQMPGS